MYVELQLTKAPKLKNLSAQKDYWRNIQSPSEYLTSLVFRWFICVLNSNGLVFKWHLNTIQFCPVFKWSISLAYVLWSENRSSFQMIKNKMADLIIWKLDTNCVRKWPFECRTVRFSGGVFYPLLLSCFGMIILYIDHSKSRPKIKFNFQFGPFYSITQ